MNERNERLTYWQGRLADNVRAYSAELEKMDGRERLYKGNPDLKALTELDTGKKGAVQKATHVQNIIAENIEAQVSSVIPQPKVTARRKKDEHLASLIENMIRNELNRMPFESINDMQERTVPIQGAGFYLVEWDNTLRTHSTVGDIVVSSPHPKQVIPQDGVFTGIEDMDYIILMLPQTKSYIERRYGVDVTHASESEPDAKSVDGSLADDMVTQYVAYYRNDEGGIGLYSWVDDTELEDIEDYQARHLPRCKKCGALKPVIGEEFLGEYQPEVRDVEGDPLADILMDEMLAAGGAPTPTGMLTEREANVSGERDGGGDVCPYCGGTEWEDSVEEYQEVYTAIFRSDGQMAVPAAVNAVDDDGVPYKKPTKIPWFKPDVYPVVMQKNVSVFGQFLGDSDVDKIAFQQNTLNRMDKKIIDRIVKAGTKITLPPRADIRIDPTDEDVIYLNDPKDKAMIDVYDFSGDLQYPVYYRNDVYEQARRLIGVTDSFQGRSDTTATSGKAKEFAAAQSAGRLESKRVMKEEAYARLFELIFLFKLAYTDEKRPVVYTGKTGDPEYEDWNRYDFLEKDEAGEYYWNTQFLFSCDTSAPLANNREAMWQECVSFFQSGAFGDPAQTETQMALWTMLEGLHHPLAAQMKSHLEAKAEKEAAQAQQMMMMQSMQPPAMPGGTGTPPTMPGGTGMPPMTGGGYGA